MGSAQVLLVAAGWAVLASGCIVTKTPEKGTVLSAETRAGPASANTRVRVLRWRCQDPPGGGSSEPFGATPKVMEGCRVLRKALEAKGYVSVVAGPRAEGEADVLVEGGWRATDQTGLWWGYTGPIGVVAFFPPFTLILLAPVPLVFKTRYEIEVALRDPGGGLLFEGRWEFRESAVLFGIWGIAGHGDRPVVAAVFAANEIAAFLEGRAAAGGP